MCASAIHPIEARYGYEHVRQLFCAHIREDKRPVGGVNFLHMCKNGLNMKRYEGYNDLADVVNWGVYETDFSLEEGRSMFPGTAVMGGLANRSGVMVDGTVEELQAAAKQVITSYGKKGFILGADCTLPTEIDYARIRAVVEAAREA